MKTKLLIGCTLAALLLPAIVRAQDEPKPAPPQIDRQKLREELRNMSPEERQAKLREMREQSGTVRPDQRPAAGALQPGGAGGLGRVLMVLTPEQRESMRAAAEADREKTSELERQIRDARKSALDALAEPKFDEADLRKKLDTAAKLETELTILRARALSKIEPPLSQEQIERIKSGQVQPLRRPAPGTPKKEAPEKLPFGNQPLPPPTNP